MIRTVLTAATLTLAALLAQAQAQAQAPQGVPVPGPVLGSGKASAPAKAPAARPGAFREIRWDELVPKDWDPMKGISDPNLGMLGDTDPKVMEMMRRMREAWDNAPTVARLDGAAIKLPGYLVPLDESKAGIAEFLLVPYFLSLIHI